MTRNAGDCWTYVKTGQKKKDGRAAFLALRDHYLGPNHVNHQATMAETKLRTLRYEGEKRRFKFEQFVTIQRAQHQTLEGLVEHGYAGIDERTKVRYLMDGIKTKDLDVCKTQIISSPTLSVDFDACVRLFQDFINQSTEKEKSTVQIALVGTKRGAKVEDRYYNRKEYATLTSEQKLELKRLREARGHKSGDGKNKRRKTNDTRNNHNNTTASINALATALSAVMMSDNNNTEADANANATSTAGDQTPPVDNRTNPALTRQQGNNRGGRR